MALIECEIQWDATTKTQTNVYKIRVDPSDEVKLINKSNDPMALQFNGEGAFVMPNGSNLYPLPPQSAHTNLPPLRPAKQIWLDEKTLAKCGVIDAVGNFEEWPGAGFPGIGH